MHCEQFEQILEQHESGTLPQLALAHTDECKGCRSLLADLGAIQRAANELGSVEIAPPERLWVSLRNALEAEGLIHEPARQMPQQVPLGWWHGYQRPALAGAFLSLVVIAASLIGFRGDFQTASVHPQFAAKQEVATTPSAESVFKEEILSVGNETTPEYRRMDPDVTSSFRRNLGVVDNFIAMCEKSVREQPDNEIARDYLYGAYQQKAALLATAMDHAATGGLQ